MQQTELFEFPDDTHKPKVFYYRCGQGLIWRDTWRYFSFKLAETKAHKRKMARDRRAARRRNRRKRNP